MTRVLSDHLPDLWRLGQAYFSGKLHKDVRTKHYFRKNAQIYLNLWKKNWSSVLSIVLVGFQVKDKNSKVDSSKQNHFKVTTLVKNGTLKCIISRIQGTYNRIKNKWKWFIKFYLSLLSGNDSSSHWIILQLNKSSIPSCNYIEITRCSERKVWIVAGQQTRLTHSVASNMC